MAHKKLTITIDESVYDGLYRTIGRGKMSQFIEDLLRAKVMGQSLDAGYAAMAADEQSEQEASEWMSGFTKDLTDETW